jgi:hypothetical protein
MPSLSIADEPVKYDAANFVAVIKPFPISAAITIFLEPDVDIFYLASFSIPCQNKVN